MSEHFSQNFSWRHRLTAALSRRLQGIVYTSKGGLTKGLRRRGGVGFLPAAAHPDTAETRFLQSLNFNGKIVYDIGGFQGLMSIFFAKTAKQVVTFEANPVNVVRIYDNARLNGFKNIFVVSAAVGNRDGMLRLWLDPLMAGAASGDPEISEQIRTQVKGAADFNVILTSIDAAMLRFGLPEPEFVKIDIEGMELDALQGMKDLIASRSPELYLELHGTVESDKRANATDVIDFIRSRGYNVFDVEQNRDITADVSTGRESHIYCKHPKSQ